MSFPATTPVTSSSTRSTWARSRRRAPSRQSFPTWPAWSTYGGPRGLRRLVEACHARGLSVFLDVVYNHLGPEGNYLAEYGPYFTDRYMTPWGPAVNFDGEGSPGVRRHIVENGRAWVSEFHVDGFRVDAVHAIHDASPVHILTEFAQAVRVEAARAG